MTEWRGRPGQSSDDGNVLVGSYSWYTAGVGIPTGNRFTYDSKAAFRYPNVTIPQGSTINSVSMGWRVYSGTYSGSTVRTKIYGIDADDVSTFSSDPTGDTRTSASVDWDDSNTYSAEDETSPPSITSIIQEIIDRPGWSSGNAIGLLIVDDGSDTSKNIRWYSYDGDSSKSPELVINYTAPATTTTTTTTTSTSTSTTNTSSSTSSSSTTTGPIPLIVPQGLVRVTKEGKDVIDDISLDDFFLDSDYPLLKVYDYGSFTTNIIGTKSISHDLGYIPYVMVFSQYLKDDGGGGVTKTDELYQHDWFIDGAAYYSYGYTKIYDDKIDISVENINTPTPGTVNGFYYIFTEEIT